MSCCFRANQVATNKAAIIEPLNSLTLEGWTKDRVLSGLSNRLPTGAMVPDVDVDSFTMVVPGSPCAIVIS